MRSRTLALVLALVSITSVFAFLDTNSRTASGTAQTIPAPEDVLGFKPGDDRKLASWNQVVEYFDRLDRASDRVKFETLGRSTMDNPFVMATISAPENLARLEEYKAIQDQLADPRELGTGPRRDRKAAELIRRGKTIVLITCGIHSTEVGSYLSSMLIAHRLASSNEPEIQNILNNTIILLVPSLNPDGVDIVKNWYDKTLGTPYEGTDPPELYHSTRVTMTTAIGTPSLKSKHRSPSTKSITSGIPRSSTTFINKVQWARVCFCRHTCNRLNQMSQSRSSKATRSLGTGWLGRCERRDSRESLQTPPTTPGRRHVRIPIITVAYASFLKQHRQESRRPSR